MKAVRLHKYHERPSVDEVPEPKVTDPLDVLVRVGAAGLCHRFAHLRGPVGAPDPSRAAVHPRPRERRVGRGGRFGCLPVAVGDTVILHPHITCGLCRNCRAGDDMHCVNSKFPAWTAPTVAWPTTCSPAPGRLSSSTRPFSRRMWLPRRRGPDRLPRGEERCSAIPGNDSAGHRRRWARPHRRPNPKALTPATIIVLDRNQAALDLVSGYGADHTVLADDKSGETILELTDAMAQKSFSTSLRSRGRRRWAGTSRDGLARISSSGTAARSTSRPLTSSPGEKHRRQPGRQLQRPRRADGAGRAGQGGAPHAVVSARRCHRRHGRPRRRTPSGPRNSRTRLSDRRMVTRARDHRHGAVMHH